MASSDNLLKLRNKIDDIDNEILQLLNERAKIALGISEHKKQNRVSVYDPVREKEIEHTLKKLNSGPLTDNSVLNIYKEIISACRELQKPLKLAFLGPEGSFSHQAAAGKFGNSSILVPVASFEDVFSEVENRRVTYGVVPVENSIEGSVNVVLDLLSRSNLIVTAELYLKIEHFLLNKTGSLKDINVVASHPQALAQCGKWINKNLPGVQLRETSSTAEAAGLAAKRKNMAAISSESAGFIYKLKTAAKNIQNSSWNTTRFFVIGHNTVGATGDDRTSIVFSLKDKPGELQKVFFEPFAKAGVNLSKIESRPSKERPWEYIFFVDFKGHRDDNNIRTLLRRLKTRSDYFKILGSYPIGNLKK